MDGAPISLVRTIPLRGDAVALIVRGVLDDLAAKSARAHLALSADLRGTGRVSVPVAVTVTHPGPASHRSEIVIEARRAPGAFPRFVGTLVLAPADGGASSALMLAGRYRVPLGAVGRTFDVTVARGVAASGLSSFLDRIVEELLAKVAQDANATYLANRRQV